MSVLISTFFIANISKEGKPTIHRMTESPARAIQYRSQEEKRLQDVGEHADVRILRQSSDGSYVDVTEGVRE